MLAEIDPTISLGSILTILTTIGSVTIGAGTIIWRMSKWETRLELMWDEFTERKKLRNER